MKYYLISKDVEWSYYGPDTGSVPSESTTIAEYDTLEEVEKAKADTYDDSIIIYGLIISGDVNAL